MQVPVISFPDSYLIAGMCIGSNAVRFDHNVCGHCCRLPIFGRNAFRASWFGLPKLFSFISWSWKSCCQNRWLWSSSRYLQKWLLSQRWWRSAARSMDGMQTNDMILKTKLMQLYSNSNKWHHLATWKFSWRRFHLTIGHLGIWCVMLGNHDTRTTTVPCAQQYRSVKLCTRRWPTKPASKLPRWFVSFDWKISIISKWQRFAFSIGIN